ncbi:MAG: lycopene cyclase domain-containing protein [Acidimicrobiales bacterium]
MREYTTLAVIAAAAVVLFELAWARTGIFSRRAYWVTMAIVFGFQSLVDGWLTRLARGHTVVIYDPRQFSGWRFPWDIPVEDFLYAFALVTIVILRWEASGAAAGRRRRSSSTSGRGPGG